jgi:spore coat protein CotH
LNSLYGPKQSYKVDINRAKKDQRLAGETTLNFVNSIPDFTYLKDALAEKLFRELGAVAPRTGYAYLTVDVAGQFQNRALGLYVLVEDIDANFAKDRFGTKDVPIFKPVTYDLFDDTAKDWQIYKEVYDLKTKATKEDWGRVEELARLTSHADDEEFARRLPEFLDLEEYAAFVAGHVLLSSYDGYLSNGQNFYMYLDPRSHKFGFIPWDQDHAWGEFGYVDTTDHREHASIWKPAAYKNKFLARVMKVEAFKEVYRKKLEQALAGPFTVEKLYREIDSLAAAIRPAIAAESEFRLKRFEIAISTNWVKGPRDAPDFKSKEGPRAPAHQIKRFVEARTKSVRAQLDGKEEGVLIRGFNE